MNKEVDRFGEFVMKNLRDRAIAHGDGLLARNFKAPALLALQREIAQLLPDQRSILRRCVVESVDQAIHDFLFALQEQPQSDDKVEVVVSGKNVAELSDGLQGEPYGSRGWQARHSKFGGGVGPRQVHEIGTNSAERTL